MISGNDVLKFSGAGTATTGTGVDLSRYPGLVHAPHQWGEGVRFAHDGTPVDDVLTDSDVSLATGSLISAAQRHGISLADLFDAIRYGIARENILA